MKELQIDSDINYIMCENFEEIFFDVYDIKFKGSPSICLESVGKYKKNPVVVYKELPMVLIKDPKRQGIYLNENNTDVPQDELINESEEVNYSEEEQLKNREYILEEIHNSKLQAKEFANNIKRIKLQEANEEIKEKKKELTKLLENTKEELINEFINISDSIRSSLFDKNVESQEVLKQSLDEELSKQRTYFEEALANDLEGAYEDFTKNLNSLVGKLWKKKISPLLEENMDFLENKVEDKFDILREDFENILNEKAEGSTVQKLEESLDSLKLYQIDLHDKVETNKKKVDNKIANLKQSTKKIHEEITLHIDESISTVENFYNSRVEKLQEETFQINENTRKFLVDTINESKAFLLEEIRTIQKEKPIEFIVESSKGSPETISLDKLKKDYDKLISDKISNEMVGVKKYIYASGGGTNATQYQNGGTMHGNLTVTGGINAGAVYVTSANFPDYSKQQIFKKSFALGANTLQTFPINVNPVLSTAKFYVTLYNANKKTSCEVFVMCMDGNCFANVYSIINSDTATPLINSMGCSVVGGFLVMNADVSDECVCVINGNATYVDDIVGLLFGTDNGLFVFGNEQGNALFGMED